MSGRARGWLAAAVGVALLSGLVVLGRGPVETAPPTPPPSYVAGRPVPPPTPSAVGDRPRGGFARTDAVSEMLAERAAAVRTRNESAFLASVDPRADPAFLAAQRALFANLAGAPLAHWSYEIDDSAVADTPAVPGDDAPRWAPRTSLRYALDGADAEPTSRPLGYTYVLRDGDWLITSDTGLGPDAPRTWRGPWDFGPVVAVSVPGGLVLGHAGEEPLLEAIAGELDAAASAVTEVWGAAWSQRVAVILPGSIEEMRELVGPAFAVDGIAAAAVADEVDPAAGRAVGQRVVLNPTQAARLSPSARRIVLRHEITHVAARATTVDGAPMWLLEGFADYVGYRGSGLSPREAAPDLVRAVRTRGAPDQLPADGDFRGGAAGLDLAYQLAWSVALHVVERAGEPGLVQLYRRIAGSRAHDAASIDQAMRDVLGLDLAGFVASWRASVATRFS